MGKIEEGLAPGEIETLTTKEAWAKWIWDKYLWVSSNDPENWRTRPRVFRGLGDRGLDSPSDCLGNFYEDINDPQQQLLFRQAIGDTLTAHGNEENAPDEAIEDLLYLIARVKAAEALEALLPTVGNGSLGRKKEKYLYSTMSILDSFTRSHPIETTKVVQDLANSINFDDGFLLNAAGMLIECDPTKASEILFGYSQRLKSLRLKAMDMGKKEWTAYYSAAKNLLEIIKRFKANIDPDTASQILFG